MGTDSRDANDPALADYLDGGTVDSLSEFIGIILDFQRSQETGGPSIWFRGQPSGAPELAPAVLRDWFLDRVCSAGQCEEETQTAVLSTELALNRQFRRRGASLLPASASLVDIYFLAQHHGMPTRLLDWSTNPMAALFFAVNSHREDDGMVLATVPDRRLTSAVADESLCDYLEGAPFDVRNELVTRTIGRLFGEQHDDLPGIVLPVIPDLHAGRMLQQGSCFTLHVPGSKPIPKNVVVRVQVPLDRKQQLAAELRSIGVTWATLFPDLDHLSYDIRTAWGLWPQRERT